MDANIPEREIHEQEILQMYWNKARIPSGLPYIILGIAVLLLYCNTFQSPFIFDDWENLSQPPIQMTRISWDAIRQAAFEGLLFRPVANVTFALNYYFDGYELFGYHLVNILVHLGAGIFLYMFLQTTLALPQARQRFEYGAWLPFTAALIWLVHPLQVQSVTYIIQRMNSLAAMFFVLSMLCYVKARISRVTWKKIVLFCFCAISAALALGSKEIAATLPFFILLYEWFFFQDLQISWLKKRFFPIAAVCVLVSIIVLAYLGTNPLERILADYKIRDFTLRMRVLTEFRVVVFYISLLLFPYPERLNLNHDFPLSLSLFEPVATFLSLCILMGLLVLAIRLAKSERLLSFCILWFLGNLFIESSFIGLEIIFEHRTYLPSMMAVFAVALLAKRLLHRRWLLILITIIVLTLFSLWTVQRNMVWANPFRLWQDVIVKSPNKVRPYNNLGRLLVESGRSREAILVLQKAIRLEPDNIKTTINLAAALIQERRFSEAITLLVRNLDRLEKSPEAHLNLGAAYFYSGNLEAARRELEILSQLDPYLASKLAPLLR
jgi:tetratricopeptide (TPR) repeat protein